MATSKKRSGPGNVFTRAQETRARQIAQREYGDVNSKGLDLKKLLATVDTVRKGYETQLKKSTINQTVTLLAERISIEEQTRELKHEATKTETKKRKVTAAQTDRADAKRRALEMLRVAAQANDALVFEATEAVRLFGVMLRVGETAKLPSKDTLNSIDSHRYKAKAALVRLKPGSDMRMRLLNQFLLYSKRYEKLKSHFNTVRDIKKDVEELVPQKPEGLGKERDRRKRQYDILGGYRNVRDGAKERLTSFHRALKLSGRALGEKVRNLSPFGDRLTTGFRKGAASGAFTVRSIAKIGTGLIAVSKSIKDTGKSTMRWVGDRISGLTRRFMGALRNLRGLAGGNGGAMDWLTTGALAAGLLPSLISGFSDYMKKQYGDDWMQSFISEKWSETKKYVLEWLEKFVNYASDAIKSIPEKAKEIAEKVKNAAKNVPFVVSEMTNPANHTKERNDIEEAIKNKTKTPQEKIIAALNKVQDPNTSKEDREEAVNEVKRLARLYPYLMEKPAIVNKMNQLGINFTYTNRYGKKINIATQQPNGDPLEKTTINSIASSASSSTLNVSGGRTSAVTPKAPAATGGGGSADAPVTATPAPATPDSGGTGDTGMQSSPRISGLSNAAIPNQATSDTLNFINMHGLGMG